MVQFIETVFFRAQENYALGIISGLELRPSLIAKGGLISATMLASGLIASFGLGEHAAANTVQVMWPSGAVQTLADIGADQRIIVIEEHRPGAVQPHDKDILAWGKVKQTNSSEEILNSAIASFILEIKAGSSASATRLALSFGAIS